MQSVSTLCATSTVGIAACGYALAQPDARLDYSNRQATAASARDSMRPIFPKHSFNSQRSTGFCQGSDPEAPWSRPSTSRRSPSFQIHGSRPSTSYALDGALNGEAVDAPGRRPSTSRRWLRRLSESFSRPNSNRPQHMFGPALPDSRPNSRPPTRNRLVKRPASHRLSISRSNSPIPPPLPPPLPPPSLPRLPRHQRRPSTAVHQPSTTRDQSTYLAPTHTSRLSTSCLRSPSVCASDSKVTTSWRPWLSRKPKKVPSPDQPTKLTKPSGIRRLVPDFLNRRPGPSLVLALAVDTSPEPMLSPFGVFAGSSDLDSVRTASRPVSHMGDFSQPRTFQRTQSSTLPAAAKRDVRRSFSLSNFLGVANAMDAKEGVTAADDGLLRLSVGVDLEGNHSTLPANSAHPYQLLARPSTPSADEGRRLPLPPIQSRSLLDLALESCSSVASLVTSPVASPVTSPASAASSEHDELSPIEVHAELLASGPQTTRPHRLSIMSASEKASTLIGSESEHDFGSDTLFDSMRTRMSGLTPVRVDSIFNYETSGENSRRYSPVTSKFPENLLSMGEITPIKVYSNHISTPGSEQTAKAAPPNRCRDDDTWSSDWDASSRLVDEDSRCFSSSAGLHPYANGFLGSRHALSGPSNTSNTSFGTAPETLPVDALSLRETNSSILDWNDGVSVHTPSPPRHDLYRPQTAHASESVQMTSRNGWRPPGFHLRSQSAPIATTLRSKAPLPSENWDDDFLEDDEDSGSEIVIPRVIEERQASIIGHLGCVREFALLVEDLKRLREKAITRDLICSATESLWEEADAIIALASVDDDEEDAPLRKDKLHRQNTWSPARRRTPYDDSEYIHRSSMRRSSVLLPDDDIFGGNESNAPSAGSLQRLSTSPAAFPSSKEPIDGNDPIEVAKSMMERMQQRHGADNVDRLGSMQAKGKVHFDTNMLKDLVAHVATLKRDLMMAIESKSFGTDKQPKLCTGVIEPPRDENFGFGINPIENSIDENIGTGFNGARRGGLGFRSVLTA